MRQENDLRNIFGVYAIVCSINSKIYVGSTCRSFYLRWRDHKTSLNKNSHCNTYLQNAWNKYGEESFSFEVLEIVENKIKEIILEREQDWINSLEPYKSEKGYNVCPTAGSRQGSRSTEETIEKLKGKIPWNKGKKGEYSLGPPSEETKKKISEAQIGKEISLETRQKMSEAAQGRICTEETRAKRSVSLKGNKNASGNTTWLGKTHSEESKQKMSESKKGKKTGSDNPFWGKAHNEETRSKLSSIHKGKLYRELTPCQLKNINGEIITITNMKQFCVENKLSTSCMSQVRAGKKKTYKGYTSI